MRPAIDATRLCVHPIDATRGAVMNSSAFVRRHAVAAYFTLAFAISWIGLLAVVLPKGLLPTRAENLVTWLLDPPRVKPGVNMPALGLTEAEAKAVAAYLLSLK